MSQQQQNVSKTKNKKKGQGNKIFPHQMCGAGEGDEKSQIPFPQGQGKAKPVINNVSRRAAGSNWNAQQQMITVKPSEEGVTITTPAVAPGTLKAVQITDAATNEHKLDNSEPLSKSARQRKKRKAQRNRFVAMDCEMVGVGHNGQNDMLARVSIVSKNGEVLLDKFVKPRENVTDYRTSVSGIRPNDIEHGEEFTVVQEQVIDILQGKVLIGHGLGNDLAVLHIKHPFVNIRDTSRYKPLCKLVSNGRTPSLKRITQAILGMEIQTGEHNSVEDARAAMNIYNRLSVDWEHYIVKHNHHRSGH